MKWSASALPHLQGTQRNDKQHSLKILDYCSSVVQMVPATVKCTHMHTTTLRMLKKNSELQFAHI